MKIFVPLNLMFCWRALPRMLAKLSYPPVRGYPRREAWTPRRGVVVGEVVVEMVVVVEVAAKQYRVAADEFE